jgi:isocitrate dehydrogenase
VNPVLREGNSDRRSARAVKAYAQAHPHSMGAWSPDVEDACLLDDGRRLPVERALGHHHRRAGRGGADRVRGPDGAVKVLKDGLKVDEGTIVDATFMSAKALRAFLEEQVEATRKAGVLFSIHLKATMMKVSDPVIFGHAVSVYLKDFLAKHAETLDGLGFDPNSGIGDLEARIATLPEPKRGELQADLKARWRRSRRSTW